MKKEIAYLHFKEHALFEDLSRENIYELLDEIVIKRKRKNEIVDFNRDDRSLLGFILKGKLKIQQLDEAGKENVKDLVHEDGYFGNLVNPQKPRYDYGTVLSDELVYFTITSERLQKLSLKFPQLGLNFSKVMNFKLNQMEDRYASLVDDDVKTRLLQFFQYWAHKDGQAEGSTIKIKNYLTHHDIADLISACRQTVTSMLNRLKKEGSILYSRREVIIPNPEALKS